MAPDPHIESLLQTLAQCPGDELQPLWSHIADGYSDGDCCKALKLLVASLTAVQRGAQARKERQFDTNPFQAPKDLPLTPQEFLHVAWQHGYSQADAEARCHQAEQKIYDAYKALGPARESIETLLENADSVIRSKDESDIRASLFSRQGIARGLAKTMRQIHGTLLTSAVKQRIIEEQKQEEPLSFAI